MKITAIVKDRKLTTCELDGTPVYGKGKDTFEWTLDEEWDGLTITAFFAQTGRVVPLLLDGTSGTAFLPDLVSGELRVAFAGQKEDEILIKTERMKGALVLKRHGATNARGPVEVEKDTYEKLVSASHGAIKAAEDSIAQTEAAKAAETERAATFTAFKEKSAAEFTAAQIKREADFKDANRLRDNAFKTAQLNRENAFVADMAKIDAEAQKHIVQADNATVLANKAANSAYAAASSAKSAADEAAAGAFKAYNIADTVKQKLDSGALKGDKGDPGEPGAPGAPGYTPVKGVDYFDGAPGEPGADGHTPAITATKEGKDTTLFADGVAIGHVLDGEDGADGSDYILTDADRQEIGALATDSLSTKIETLKKQVQRNTSRIEVAEAVLSEGDFGWKLETEESYEHVVPANAVKVEGTTHSFADVVGIEGETVAWNQHMSGDAGKYRVSSYSVAYSDNTITLTNPNNYTHSWARFGTNDGFQAGHKVYVSGVIRSSFTPVNSVRIVFSDVSLNKQRTIAVVDASTANNDVPFSGIETSPSESYGDSFVFITHSLSNNDGFTASENFKIKDFAVIDLTQLFGAGNEPTDLNDPRIAWVKQYAEQHPEYNAGELVSAEVERVESWGKNLWISDGVTTNENGDNRNGVSLPAGSYEITNNSNGYIHWRDGASSKVVTSVAVGNTVAVTANAALYVWTGGVVNYGVIITRANNMLDSIDIPELNLKSAGSVSDRADFVAGVVERRVGVVDLGTLKWNADTPLTRFQTDGLIRLKANGNFNIVCDKYPVASANSVTGMGDKEIKGNATAPALYVKDSAYTTASEFKAAMNGVMLYYELAEPTTEPLEVPKSFMEAEPNGTIRFAQDGNTMPVPHAVQFPVNHREGLSNG